MAGKKVKIVDEILLTLHRKMCREFIGIYNFSQHERIELCAFQQQRKHMRDHKNREKKVAVNERKRTTYR